jgi:phage baseplate assembly protein gpV
MTLPQSPLGQDPLGWAGSSANLYETIQKIVRQELGRVRTAELAVVQEQHPHASDGDQDNYACTVQLRDSELVLKQVPVATGRIGSASIPAVGDLVLVQFVGGDVNAPVIVGSFYNDEDRPPVNADGGWVLHLPLGAGDADAVHLEVTSKDARSLVLKLGNGLEATLQDDDPVIELKVAGGNATVKIGRDGAVSVESSGNVEMKGSGNINIEAQGQLTLKGATVNIN